MSFVIGKRLTRRKGLKGRKEGTTSYDYARCQDHSSSWRVPQAACSGKQNIVEGSMASGTSKEMELKLTNVARASLEELLADYQDFLRVNGLQEWDGRHPYALRLSSTEPAARCRLRDLPERGRA